MKRKRYSLPPKPRLWRFAMFSSRINKKELMEMILFIWIFAWVVSGVIIHNSQTQNKSYVVSIGGSFLISVVYTLITAFIADQIKEQTSEIWIHKYRIALFTANLILLCILAFIASEKSNALVPMAPQNSQLQDQTTSEKLKETEVVVKPPLSKMAAGAALFSTIWSSAFVYGIFLLAQLPRMKPTDLSSMDFVSGLVLTAFGCVVGSLTADISFWGVFCGVSFVLGPIWAYIVWCDINRTLGGMVFLMNAVLGSYLITGSFFSITAMIGTLLGPVIGILLLVVFVFKSVKDSAKRTFNLTDRQAEEYARRKLDL